MARVIVGRATIVDRPTDTPFHFAVATGGNSKFEKNKSSNYTECVSAKESRKTRSAKESSNYTECVSALNIVPISVGGVL